MPAAKKKSKKTVRRNPSTTRRKRPASKSRPGFHPQYYTHSQPYPQQVRQPYHPQYNPYAPHPYARYPYFDPVYGYNAGYGGLLGLGLGLGLLKGQRGSTGPAGPRGPSGGPSAGPNGYIPSPSDTILTANPNRWNPTPVGGGGGRVLTANPNRWNANPVGGPAPASGGGGVGISVGTDP